MAYNAVHTKSNISLRKSGSHFFGSRGGERFLGVRGSDLGVCGSDLGVRGKA